MFSLLPRTSLQTSFQVSCSVVQTMSMESSVISTTASNLFLTAQLNLSFISLDFVCEHCTDVVLHLLSLRISSALFSQFLVVGGGLMPHLLLSLLVCPEDFFSSSCLWLCGRSGSLFSHLVRPVWLCALFCVGRHSWRVFPE